MVKTTALRSTESSKRLLLRDTAHTLTQIIETGTNCSNFEATIISQKAQEVYQLGEYNTDNVLQPGQMVWKAISATEPAGKPLDQCEFKRIILTVHNIDEDKDIQVKYNHSVKRGQQILRITTEALEQDTLLTQEDLGFLLDCDVKTIRTDIKRYQKKHSILVPTRGNKQDIGPGITHKDKIVEMYIKGNDAVTIARNMKHSLKAVERYIHTFCRVLYCQKQLHNSLNTAMVVWKEN